MTLHLELPLVQEVKQEASKKVEIDWAKVLFFVLSALPLFLGWLAAKTVRMTMLFVAALKIGYRKGMKSGSSG